ncbi:MAG: YihY family inner membrane protein [candidate division Zixibacteria bacterium]|nr:YihY family inner membrane protein [candidate division Zixibacteria bacterium]
MDPIGWIRDRFFRLSDAIYAHMPAQPRLRRFGLRLSLTLLMAGHRFRRMRGFGAASELAYRTLFALVPVTALVVTVMAGFVASPDFLSDEALRHLIPASGQVVSDYIREFSHAAHAISAISLALFAVTAISLLMSVEDAINLLWNIPVSRNFIVKVGVYGALLLIAPLLLAASLYLTDQVLVSLVSRQIFGWETPPYGLSYVLSFLFTLIVFFLVYYKLPNTLVSSTAAAVGASVAGVVWETAKHLFDWYIGQAVTYHVIYGSLSIIPFFLLWLYLSWTIMLWGSQIVYCWQYLPALKSRSMPNPMTEWEKASMAIRLLVRLAERWEIGSGGMPVKFLLDEMRADRFEVREILDTLTHAGFVTLFKDEEEICLLSRTPTEIALYEVIALFDKFSLEPTGDENDTLGREIADVGRLLQEGMKDRMNDVTLDTLIKTLHSAEQTM